MCKEIFNMRLSVFFLENKWKRTERKTIYNENYQKCVARKWYFLFFLLFCTCAWAATLFARASDENEDLHIAFKQIYFLPLLIANIVYLIYAWMESAFLLSTYKPTFFPFFLLWKIQTFFEVCNYPCGGSIPMAPHLQSSATIANTPRKNWFSAWLFPLLQMCKYSKNSTHI